MYCKNWDEDASNWYCIKNLYTVVVFEMSLDKLSLELASCWVKDYHRKQLQLADEKTTGLGRKLKVDLFVGICD